MDQLKFKSTSVHSYSRRNSSIVIIVGGEGQTCGRAVGSEQDVSESVDGRVTHLLPEAPQTRSLLFAIIIP